MSPSSSARKKTAVSEKPEAATGECVHHWVIDPPNGAVSKGRCKTCGEEKEFRNSFEYSSWYGNKSPGAKGGPGARESGADPAGPVPAATAPKKEPGSEKKPPTKK